jgi:uncharacterized protein YecE (DUF72 family)
MAGGSGLNSNGGADGLVDPLGPSMRFFVGTSGYSYKEWKGSFYPEKLPQKEMLTYYAQKFSTVEVNNTFYRMPSESDVASWAGQTPDSFHFVLKAPQAITHHKRLKDVEDATEQFLHAALALKERQGPVLFQLPPNFKKDLPRLESFLKLIGKRISTAFEFRHVSWHDDEVADCLRAHSCALCVADADDTSSTDLVRTSDWGYVRLRCEDYTDEQLKEWVKRIRSQNWSEAYVFFKHEDTGTGPKFAGRFLEQLKL